MQLQAYRYEIQVQFHLSSDWAAALPAQLALGYNPAGIPISTISLSIQDQAELIGILNELHGNGVRIISVRDKGYSLAELTPDRPKDGLAAGGAALQGGPL